MASVDAARALAGVGTGTARVADAAADGTRLLELMRTGDPELTARLPREFWDSAALERHIANLTEANDFTKESARREIDRYLATWQHAELPEGGTHPRGHARSRPRRGCDVRAEHVDRHREVQAARHLAPDRT